LHQFNGKLSDSEVGKYEPDKNYNFKSLKPAEKSLLIEALLRSLDIADPKIEKIWSVEAEKRLKAYKAGKIKTVSFENMFAK
jgi:putative addiction module component (TIGR02574 family)